MARAAGISAPFSGRTGDKVFYQIKGTKMRQGMRIYQPVVTNPNTIGQLLQRVKVAPTQNLYRALKSVIDRSFQGKKYGNASRLRFLSLAMTQSQHPWLIKGNKEAVPFPTLISEGSLVPITISGITASNDATIANAAITDLGVDNGNLDGHIGGLSASLIANNTDIQEGDQIAIVFCAMYGQSFVYRVIDFLVDTSSTETFSSIGITALGQGSVLYIGLSSALAADEHLVAAAVIQSRKSGDTWLRSTAKLAINRDYISHYFDISAYGEAISSYLSSDGSVDWPVVEVADATPNIISSATALLTNATKTTSLPGSLPDDDNLPSSVEVLGFIARDGRAGVFAWRDMTSNSRYLGKYFCYRPDGTINQTFAFDDEEDLLAGTSVELVDTYKTSYGSL